MSDSAGRVSRIYIHGKTSRRAARSAARKAHNLNYRTGKLDGWQMNALQRRNELDRLARYRARLGTGFGPASGWIEVIANYLRVRNGQVTADEVRTEALRLGLTKLDPGLISDAVEHIAHAAWGRYKLFTPKLAGDKLRLTMVERDAAEIQKIEAFDETRADRRRRADRARKREKRAAEAALLPQKLTKKALSEALGVSRPTLDRWIKSGKFDPITGEVLDALSVRRSMIPYGDKRLTENVNLGAPT